MAERRRRVRGAPLCARIITNLTCACDRVPCSSGNPPPYLRTDSQVYFQSRTPAGRVRRMFFPENCPANYRVPFRLRAATRPAAPALATAPEMQAVALHLP